MNDRVEKPKLEFVRATADHGGTCQPCQQETNRLTAFRVIGAPRWDAMFLCDDCQIGMAAARNKPPAEG